MKALVCHGPNDLRVEDLPAPAFGASEVLVDVGAGGVCGSDLHYFQNGGFGAVRIREPMILGHEVAGTVSAIGSDVTTVQTGERVAVNPSRPCGHCGYCIRAEWNHCLNMRFYGSAMPFPHIQGAFAEQLTVLPAQCEPIGANTSMHHAAMAEPLSVALHAVSRAGSLAGKHVLVSGCGPIGAFCVVAARFLGALTITVTDLVDAPLQVALALGADEAINVSAGKSLDQYAEDKGHFDVVIEASGAQPALLKALDVARPRAGIVQLGLGGDITLPMNTVVAKELRLLGSFRFHDEFGWAAQLIREQRVNLEPLLTDVFPATDAVAAFSRAADRSRAMKVQLKFV
jgi:L-idonate 5-dehydrogenase